MRKNVLEYLESSARMHADKPAFCDENRVFTFGELLKAAQGLGTHLAGAVDTLHKPVAVLIGRTAESVAAMQGVLYAGGCYVPIDDHMPEARIRRVFEQVSKGTPAPAIGTQEVRAGRTFIVKTNDFETTGNIDSVDIADN